MLNMENAEEVMQILERFTRLKQKEIPKELDDYMHYVAKTGDTVFKWPSLKYLFREKLLNVIKNFHDTSPRVDDLPQYPNVDPFNYESMKSSLLERLELFNAAPFTVQRLCELLTEPRKQYSRIDKFMRALEKNILVSTIEPGRKRTESENGDSLDSVVNGDVSLDVNVDIEMENETVFNAETQQVNAASSTSPPSQPSSNLIHKSDDDILPNPKKPKLDLDETNDAETEAATKSITTIKTDALEVIVEKVPVEEMTDITDNKKNEERIAEAATTEKAVAEPESKMDNKETEKMEEDSSAVATAPIETSSVDTAKEVESEKKTEEKEATISSESAEAEVAKQTPAASAPEVVVAVEAVDSSEKPEKVDDEPEKKKKDCAEEVLAKKDEAKDIDAEKPIKDDVEPQNGENKENEEKTETTITPEQANDKQTVATPEDTIAPSNEKTPDEVVKDKAEETVAADEPKVEVAAAKADIAASAEEPSKSEDVKPAEDTATNTKAEALPVASEEVKEASTETTTKPPEQVDAAAQPPPPTESPIKEPVVAPAETQPAESKEKETEKPVEVVVPVAVESTPVVIPVVPIVEPVVTADQPMEENLESIAEAEPVVPAIIVEAAANVEEVVMKDSGVEMATDAIEPSKDEPAGMEVDDTSQEAMDQ